MLLVHAKLTTAYLLGFLLLLLVAKRVVGIELKKTCVKKRDGNAKNGGTTVGTSDK